MSELESDPVARFNQLVQSGMSQREATQFIMYEIMDRTLREAEHRKQVLSLLDLLQKMGLNDGDIVKGIIRGLTSQPNVPTTGQNQDSRIPVYEAKLLKPVRLEPDDLSRLERVVSNMTVQARASGDDAPTDSSVLRQAIRLGLSQLERQNSNQG